VCRSAVCVSSQGSREQEDFTSTSKAKQIAIALDTPTGSADGGSCFFQGVGIAAAARSSSVYRVERNVVIGSGNPAVEIPRGAMVAVQQFSPPRASMVGAVVGPGTRNTVHRFNASPGLVELRVMGNPRSSPQKRAHVRRLQRGVMRARRANSNAAARCCLQVSR